MAKTARPSDSKAPAKAAASKGRSKILGPVSTDPANKTEQTPKRPTGRPSDFNEEIANAIIEWIADGKSLRSFCEQEGTPSKSTIMRWLGEHEAFRTSYAHAREAQADSIVDEALDIADHTDGDFVTDDKGNLKLNKEAVLRSRLRVETRFKAAALLNPKKYGDKLQVDANVNVNTMTDEQLDAKLAALAAKAVGNARGGD